MSYVHVKVIVSARKENFREINEDHFEVSVKEKPKHNMANKRVLELVANHFKVTLNKVRIINGHMHPSKLLVVDEDFKNSIIKRLDY